MKDLINSIIAALNTAITAGTITATHVYKGLQNNPEEIATDKYPYIAVDEQGERVDEGTAKSNTAYNRIYSVAIEFAVWTNDIETSLDNILDLSNQIELCLEKETNRFLDSHVFGINIRPFQWVQDEKCFFRGRQVTIDYYDLKDKYDDF